MRANRLRLALFALALSADTVGIDVERIGRPVRLRRSDEAGVTRPYTPSDCHLLTTATLRALGAAYPQGRFVPARFRPNVVLECGADVTGFVESGWLGSELAFDQICGTNGVLIGDRGATATTSPHPLQAFGSSRGLDAPVPELRGQEENHPDGQLSCWSVGPLRSPSLRSRPAKPVDERSEIRRPRSLCDGEG